MQDAVGGVDILVWEVCSRHMLLPDEAALKIHRQECQEEVAWIRDKRMR